MMKQDLSLNIHEHDYIVVKYNTWFIAISRGSGVSLMNTNIAFEDVFCC